MDSDIDLSPFQEVDNDIMSIVLILILLVTLYRIWRSMTVQLCVYHFGAFCGYTLYQQVLECWLQRGYELENIFDERFWLVTVARFKTDLEKTDTSAHCNLVSMRVWRHVQSLDPWFFVKELQWTAI